MTKITKLLPFLLLLTVFACTKDDLPDNNPSVEGLWKVTNATCDNGVATISINSETFMGTFVSVGEDYGSTVTFGNDGSMFSEGILTHSATVSIAGQLDQTAVLTQENFLGEGEYEVSGSILKLTKPGNPTQDYEILSNDGQTLQIQGDVTFELESVDSKDDMSGTFVYTLTKV